jgi:hypothetical protein
VPTATHSVREGHATASIVTSSAPAGLGIAARDQRVPFQRSAIGWVAICGKFAPTARQSDIVQQWRDSTVAGNGAARPAVMVPGRAVTVAADAAPAATGTAIAAAAATAAMERANRVRDAKSLSSRDVSTRMTIGRGDVPSHDRDGVSPRPFEMPIVNVTSAVMGEADEQMRSDFGVAGSPRGVGDGAHLDGRARGDGGPVGRNRPPGVGSGELAD